MDAALLAACAEFGPRLTEEALREAGAPDAWSGFVAMAQEICDMGGDGAEFLRRLSILVYAYASAVIIHKRLGTQAHAAASDDVGAAQLELPGAQPSLPGHDLMKGLVQLSLWESDYPEFQ
jgi:hypothetical protein